MLDDRPGPGRYGIERRRERLSADDEGRAVTAPAIGADHTFCRCGRCPRSPRSSIPGNCCHSASTLFGV